MNIEIKEAKEISKFVNFLENQQLVLDQMLETIQKLQNEITALSTVQEKMIGKISINNEIVPDHDTMTFISGEDKNNQKKCTVDIHDPYQDETIITNFDKMKFRDYFIDYINKMNGYTSLSRLFGNGDMMYGLYYPQKTSGIIICKEALYNIINKFVGDKYFIKKGFIYNTKGKKQTSVINLLEQCNIYCKTTICKLTSDSKPLQLFKITSNDIIISTSISEIQKKENRDIPEEIKTILIESIKNMKKVNRGGGIIDDPLGSFMYSKKNKYYIISKQKFMEIIKVSEYSNYKYSELRRMCDYIFKTSCSNLSSGKKIEACGIKIDIFDEDKASESIDASSEKYISTRKFSEPAAPLIERKGVIVHTSDSTEFKNETMKKVALISRGTGNSRNKILNGLYKKLNSTYGIVWEQLNKEYREAHYIREEKGRISTLDLIYFDPTVREIFSNILADEYEKALKNADDALDRWSVIK